jgi:acyl transferase domain-containing protein
LYDDDVAVVGMALRFPGADSPEEFWDNLLAGRESLVEISEEQLRAAGVSESTLADPDYVRVRPLLRDPDLFDAEHFGLTPREAQILNPQHRLFLEACDGALQRAGVDPRRTPAIGVWGGLSPNRYIDNVYFDAVSEYVGEIAVEISNQPDYLATRVSHLLGLTGPAITVQTACSTALVAVHQARLALLNDECELALAGGVSIELPYWTGRQWSANGIHSADGHCRAFDRDASGTNFGSGVGVVLLKRLSHALRDGDHVHAVIAGSLTNNDGGDRAGFTSPGPAGQIDLLRRCLEQSAVDPAAIGYIEAHGTGTVVGDPIEVSSIRTALAELGYAGPTVAKIPIGSVKTNIGHLGPAAGIAGLIKTVLAVEHGTIVPSLNFAHPNPAIDFDRSPLHVATEAGPWPRQGARVATVSSFGIGGTNAVAVVRGTPRKNTAVLDSAARTRVVPLSAADEARLGDTVSAAAEQLCKVDDAQFGGVARTLQGRAARTHRCAVVAASCADAGRQLQRGPRGRRIAEDRRVAWLFPGQGSQFPGMGAGVGGDAVFGSALHECLDLFEREGLADLRALLLHEKSSGGREADSSPDERLAMTSLAQAALFSTGYALGRAWERYAGPADVLIGHSIGEYAAACLAGVLSLPDAVRAVAARGRLMQEMPRGSMLAVMRDVELVRALVPDALDIAALNGPESFVVSGPDDHVTAFEAKLRLLTIEHSRLHTSHAFHSAMMQPAREALREVMADIDLHPPRRTIVSTVTGAVLTEQEATSADYWADQLVRPVRFGDAIARAKDLAGIYVELGPGRALSTLTSAAQGPEARTVATLPRPSATARDDRHGCGLLTALADFWTHGGHVDWDALDDAPPGREVFPPGAQRRTSYWVDDPVVDEDDDGGDRFQSGPLPVDETAWLPVWHRTPAPVAEPAPDGAWLVVHDGSMDGIVDRLRQHGDRVVSAQMRPAGSSEEDARTSTFEDKVLEEADPWRRLCEELDRDDLAPTTVVYAQRRVTAGTADDFFDLLHLLQSVLERWGDRDLVVRAVTVGSQDVGGGVADPAGALLHGPVSVLTHEFPTLRGGCIDVGPSFESPQVDALVRELRRSDPEPWVALRGRARWVREFETFPVFDQAERVAPVIRSGGAYLITGGTGAIGLQVLRYLAGTPATRVALLSRSGPRAVGFEDSTLTKRTGDVPVPPTLEAALETARRNGVEVVALTGDVSQPDSLRTALTSITERWGSVTGVFHAAGQPGGELALLRSDDSCRSVLAPKVAGTLALLDAVHGTAEFVALFSSIIAVSSDPGMVDYCAANSFMDSCALAYSDGRTRVLSVDWCGWAESGMVVAARSVASDIVRDAAMGISSRVVAHPLIDRRLVSDDRPTYVSVVEPTSGDYLDDHRMGGARVISGTTLVEMVRAAASDALNGRAVEVRDVVLGEPVVVDRVTELVVAAGSTDDATTEWQVVARAHGSRSESARVCAVAQTAPLAAAEPQPLDLAAIAARCPDDDWLPDFTPDAVVQIGPRWQAIQEIRRGSGEQLLRLQLDRGARQPGVVLHPVLLDNASALGLFLPDVLAPGRTFLPSGYGRVQAWGALPEEVVVHVVPRDEDLDDETLTFDLQLTDCGGAVVARVDGFRILVLDDRAPAAVPAAGHALQDVDVYADSGQYLLTPDEGIRLLDALLRQPVADHVTLSRRVPGVEDVLPDAEDSEATPADEVVGDGDDGLTTTQAMVARMWRAALGQPVIHLDDDFFDIGGNSLVVVQLLAKMRREVGVVLPGRLLVEHPTIRQLAAAVDTLVEAQAGSSR